MHLVVLCGNLDPITKNRASRETITHLGVDDQGEEGDEEEQQAGGEALYHVQHHWGGEEQDLKQKYVESQEMITIAKHLDDQVGKVGQGEKDEDKTESRQQSVAPTHSSSSFPLLVQNLDVKFSVI